MYNSLCPQPFPILEVRNEYAEIPWCVCVHVCTCVYMFVHVHVCLCVCMGVVGWGGCLFNTLEDVIPVCPQYFTALLYCPHLQVQPFCPWEGLTLQNVNLMLPKPEHQKAREPPEEPEASPPSSWALPAPLVSSRTSLRANRGWRSRDSKLFPG